MMMYRPVLHDDVGTTENATVTAEAIVTRSALGCAGVDGLLVGGLVEGGRIYLGGGFATHKGYRPHIPFLCRESAVKRARRRICGQELVQYKISRFSRHTLPI